jgi:ferritin
MLHRQPDTIRRAPGGQGPDIEIGTAVLDAGQKVTLYRIDRNHPLFNGGRLNEGAWLVLKQVEDLTKREGEWRKELTVVSAHYGGGTAKLATVKQEAGAIGERTRGRSGQYTRASIEGYDAAVKEANDAFGDLVDKQQGVGEAISRLRTLALEAEQADKVDALKAAEKEVADEKERVATEKKYLTKVLDLATVVVKPTEWVGTAVDAVTFVGDEAIDRLYTNDRLGELERKLAEAQAALRRVQHAVYLSKVNTANIALERAQDALRRAKAHFREVTDTLRLKETTVVETLGASRATRGAAAAVAERGKVSQAALDAADHLAQYVRRTEASDQYAGILFDRYDGVLQAAQFIAEKDAPDKEHAQALASFATMNRDGLVHIDQWLAKKRAEAEKSSSILATGRFFAGYADIPRALSDAVKHRNEPAPKRGR